MGKQGWKRGSLWPPSLNAQGCLICSSPAPNRGAQAAPSTLLPSHCEGPLLDGDNEQSKSCPTQPEMGSPALERVPQGISLCLLVWSSQSFLLSDLHLTCFSGKHFHLSPAPLHHFPSCLAWMSEGSQEKAFPRFACRD